MNESSLLARGRGHPFSLWEKVPHTFSLWEKVPHRGG
jgi:hypothetical protein